MSWQRRIWFLQRPRRRRPMGNGSTNPTLANHARAPFARLFRCGPISYHGAFISFSSIVAVQALPIAPKYWRRVRNRHKPRLVISAQEGSPGPVRQNI